MDESTRVTWVRQHLWLLGCLLVLAASLAGIGQYFPILLLPPAVLLAIIRFSPPRLPRNEPLANLDRAELRSQTGWIAGYVALLILLSIPGSYLIRLHSDLLVARIHSPLMSWQHIAGSLLFGILPALVLAVRFGGGPRGLGLAGLGRKRWLWPAVPIAATAGFQAAVVTFAGHAAGLPAPGETALAVSLAFLGAALPEELLFRVLLQTRLEALLGRWNGIAVASLLFGLLHAPQTYFLTSAGHGSVLSAVWFSISAVIASQAVGGFVYGYLWSRYRNAWAQFLVHGIGDTISFIAVLVGAASLG